MADSLLTGQDMLRLLLALDKKLRSKTTLIIGGGGAMVLAYKHPLGTHDIDGFAKGMSHAELDVLVKQVAADLKMPPDWLNSYFSTFTHTLPAGYDQRLVEVFDGANLKVRALGREDLMIMKVFARRPKDVGHIKALIKQGVDTDFVVSHIESLEKKRIQGANEALVFLHDILDQLED